MTDLNDTALLDEWVEHHNPDAFTEMIRRHSGMVYGTCLRILKDTAETEEVVQECFMTLATAHSSIRTSL